MVKSSEGQGGRVEHPQSDAAATSTATLPSPETADRAKDLRRAIIASLIAVKGNLDQPYPDDQRWTPWTRFVERTLGQVDELAALAIDAIHGRELARLDTENERRLRDTR